MAIPITSARQARQFQAPTPSAAADGYGVSKAFSISVQALYCCSLRWRSSPLPATVDDYYHVPHACECFECAHGMKTYPDGNTYCAKFPPKDIKMAQVSPAYVNLCQFIVAFCGITALTCALLTLLLGVQWLLVTGIPEKPARWYVVMARTAPAMAFFLPILALLFSFPYGIVPM